MGESSEEQRKMVEISTSDQEEDFSDDDCLIQKGWIDLDLLEPKDCQKDDLSEQQCLLNSLYAALYIETVNKPENIPDHHAYYRKHEDLDNFLTRSMNDERLTKIIDWLGDQKEFKTATKLTLNKLTDFVKNMEREMDVTST